MSSLIGKSYTSAKIPSSIISVPPISKTSQTAKTSVTISKPAPSNDTNYIIIIAVAAFIFLLIMGGLFGFYIIRKRRLAIECSSTQACKDEKKICLLPNSTNPKAKGICVDPATQPCSATNLSGKCSNANEICASTGSLKGSCATTCSANKPCTKSGESCGPEGYCQPTSPTPPTPPVVLPCSATNLSGKCDNVNQVCASSGILKGSCVTPCSESKPCTKSGEICGSEGYCRPTQPPDPSTLPCSADNLIGKCQNVNEICAQAGPLKGSCATACSAQKPCTISGQTCSVNGYCETVTPTPPPPTPSADCSASNLEGNCTNPNQKCAFPGVCKTCDQTGTWLMLEGIDIAGDDISVKYVDDVNACALECLKDPSCAYSVKDTGSGMRTCWLKENPRLLEMGKPNRTSLIQLFPNQCLSTISGRWFTVDNVDVSGQNYQNRALPAVDMNACRQLCLGVPGCVGVVKDQNNQDCWLKQSVGGTLIPTSGKSVSMRIGRNI